MTRRSRCAAVVLALTIVVPPLPAEAQLAVKPVKIGVLSPQSVEASRAAWESFRLGLRELGWEDGRNIAVEARFADGKLDRLRALAEELLAMNVALIVAANSSGIRAATAATKTVPIVMVEVGDPVATGFVSNLSRPGGNVTGVSNMNRDVTQKRLELLVQAVPGAERVAVIMDPGDPIIAPQWREAETASERLGVQLHRLEVRNLGDLRLAFQAAVDRKVRAVLRLFDPLAAVLGAETVALAAKHRLPAMLTSRQLVEAGGLMSYGADRLAYHRRAASYVDRILRGAKPAELPIEQPTKFELVINLRAAQTLGLTIPSTLLLRADHVIQ